MLRGDLGWRRVVYYLSLIESTRGGVACGGGSSESRLRVKVKCFAAFVNITWGFFVFVGLFLFVCGPKHESSLALLIQCYNSLK